MQLTGNNLYALKKEYAGLLKISDNSEDFFKRKGRAAMTLIAAATNPGLIVGKEKEDAYLNLQWPPREIREDKDLLEELEEYVQIETPSKYKWLVTFLKEQKKKNKKTLVWSSFIGNIIALERLLKKEFDPAVIYGKYSQEERKLALKKFKESVNCFVLITNPQTLGEGISLHKVCNDAVYIDRTYNAGQYLQSVDRIHRLGLSRETITNIFILLTKGTIDSKVDHRLEEKITRMYEMLNDNDLPIHELNSNDTSLYNSFDNKDIEDFLNHLINND